MALVDYVSSDDEEDLQDREQNSPSDGEGNENADHTINTPGNRELHQNSLKRKYDAAAPSDLPPLPSKFLDLYASNVRTSTRDDPSLHGGRKRTTPHVQGNWPTHLYIECNSLLFPFQGCCVLIDAGYPNSVELGILTSLVDSFSSQSKYEPLHEGDINVQSLLKSDLGSPLPLHISLSRPIGLSTSAKDDFLSSLEVAISNSNIRP